MQRCKILQSRRKQSFEKLVDIYAAGDVSALDQVVAPHYVGHPSAGDRDLEGLRQSILYFHNLFIYTKDSFHIEDQLVDGEKVVTRMTAPRPATRDRGTPYPAGYQHRPHCERPTGGRMEHLGTNESNRTTEPIGTERLT